MGQLFADHLDPRQLFRIPPLLIIITINFHTISFELRDFKSPTTTYYNFVKTLRSGLMRV